ncbi:hypothetical protein D3C75_414350 [compost metagenome]
MSQRVPLASLLTKAILHLAAKAIQLFAQWRQQAIQTLAVLFFNFSAALFKDSVGEVFKLFAESLFAIKHLAMFIVSI